MKTTKNVDDLLEAIALLSKGGKANLAKARALVPKASPKKIAQKEKLAAARAEKAKAVPAKKTAAPKAPKAPAEPKINPATGKRYPTAAQLASLTAARVSRKAKIAAEEKAAKKAGKAAPVAAKAKPKAEAKDAAKKTGAALSAVRAMIRNMPLDELLYAVKTGSHPKTGYLFADRGPLAEAIAVRRAKGEAPAKKAPATKAAATKKTAKVPTIPSALRESVYALIRQLEAFVDG